MSNKELPEELVKMIKRHEGFRSKPYRDTEGILTVAYGRNLEGVGVSENEGDFMVRNDIRAAISEAEFSFGWFKELNQPRQWAVIDMILNMGLGGFLGFKRMIAAVSVRDYERASKEMMDSKWSTQVGRRAYEDSEMMRTGEFLKHK